MLRPDPHIRPVSGGEPPTPSPAARTQWGTRRASTRRTVRSAAVIAACAGSLGLLLLLPGRMFGAVEPAHFVAARSEVALAAILIAFAAALWAWWAARRHPQGLRASTRWLGRLPLLLISPLMVAALAATWIHR
jgi:hypothetical protein